jgi:hypothetical protein
MSSVAPGVTPKSYREHRPESFAGAPVWARALVALGALLFAAGGILALVRPGLMVSSEVPITAGVRVYAGYMASRNLSIAALLLGLFAAGARRGLAVLMLLAGVVQVVDACMDVFEGRWPIAPGVLVLAVLFLLAAARLAGPPFWKNAAPSR